MGLPINDLNLLYTSLFSFRPADPEDIGVIGGSDGSSSVQTLPSSGMIQTSGQASDSAYIGRGSRPGCRLLSRRRLRRPGHCTGDRLRL